MVDRPGGPRVEDLCRLCVEGSPNLGSCPNITEGIESGIWLPVVIDDSSLQQTRRGNIVVEFWAPALVLDLPYLDETVTLEYYAKVAGIRRPRPRRQPPADPVYDVVEFYSRRNETEKVPLPKPLCVIPNRHAGVNGLF
jgi:hypothetical protein